MSLTREQIVSELIKIVGADQVVTEEEVLKESSVDRFRRFEELHGVYTQPLPAAVVYVRNTNRCFRSA
jgi:alkyldihydroxyacetonephosphate synthase